MAKKKILDEPEITESEITDHEAAECTESDTASSTGFTVGDIVDFVGGEIYTTATAPAAATMRPASRCILTAISSAGKHQYHLISEDGIGVHGWVDPEKVTTIQ